MRNCVGLCQPTLQTLRAFKKRMLQIVERPLSDSAHAVLRALQAQVDSEPDYASRVATAKRVWKSKASGKAKADAFLAVRQTLALMCLGPIRCAYCEDSLADEIEHIRPKNFFPEQAFVWENYLYSCGPCNGPKGSRFAVVSPDGQISEIFRPPLGPFHPPPVGDSGLIDPRRENPLDFLELDLGGVAPDGQNVTATFEFIPNDAAAVAVRARAAFSIDVLGLNREVMRVARENAFSGFRARLREYADAVQNSASDTRLSQLRKDLLSTPHLTVFAEMRRQKTYLPEIRALFDRAPEAETWPLTPIRL